MYSSIRWLIVAAAVMLAVGPIGAQRIKVTTQTVPLYVTVTDSEKRLVPDLTRDDFEVYDNAKLQTLTNFDNEPTPITVVVMLDTSGSMTLALDLVKDGAEQFLMRMMPLDMGMVGAFNDRIEFNSRFMNDRDQLVTDIKNLDYGNATRLWDAIAASLDELKGIDGRRVILVFTDGDDTGSRNSSMGKIIDRARAEEVMIYAIGLESQILGQRTKPDRGLRKIADETGGGYFELTKTSELSSTFTRVAQELHSQYVLGFTPTMLDGKVHKLLVRVKKPGMNARARRSYLAGTEKGPAQ